MMNNNKIKAIANATRLQIVQTLHKAKEMNVSALEKAIGLSQSALSQHLAIMRRADIVSTRRDAQQIFYSVKDKKALTAVEIFMNW